MLALCVRILLPLSISDCAAERTAGHKAAQSLIMAGFKLRINSTQLCAVSLIFMVLK